jgi:hypothetical protein
MSEEEKFEYPKVEFIRRRIDHNGVEVVEISMYSIVLDDQVGAPIEVYQKGYYPYQGEKNFQSEFAFAQIFHKHCAIVYVTGMGIDDMEAVDEGELPFKSGIEDIDITDDGRFE